MSAEPAPPLVVDLDGTLVHSDTLHESLLLLLRRNPLYLLLLPVWLLRGKAGFKREVALRAVPAADALPYNQALLAWLHGQRAHRHLVLCTAADAAIAEAVGDHLQLFDEVIASDGETNLSAQHKAERLSQRFGIKGFDYAGNSRADVAVWRQARLAIVVNASAGTRRLAGEHADLGEQFDAPAIGIGTWLRALRVHQWTKNLLVLVPLLTAHLVLEPQAISQALLAVLAFCLCASSVYLLNDLVDLQADRGHVHKRQRPFAAGVLPLSAGMWLAPVLLLAAFAVASVLPARFIQALAAYYLLTLLYSLWLKRVEMLDVVVLAALFTIRIAAGAFALAVALSFWLLAFSMFLFLSLALVKRCTELRLMQALGQENASGRGYRVDDLGLLTTLGATSGFLSILVLALYVNSTHSEQLYSEPRALWLLCPLLLYWISRVWLLTQRGRMADDPVLFALRDPASWSVLALALAATALAL